MSNQLTFDNIQFVSYGVHDKFPGKLNPIAAAIRGESEMGGGGGILKTLVGIAVAIAIPIVAPQIATALGASAAWGGLASAGVGAVLGGVTTAAMGGDWKTGALMGGIGGGIGGWQQGMGFTGSSVPVQNATGFTAGPNSAVITNSGSGTGVWDASKNAFVDPMNGAVVQSQNIAYGGNISADVASKLSSGAIDSQALANSMTNVTANTTLGGARALGATNLYDPRIGTGVYAPSGTYSHTFVNDAGQTITNTGNTAAVYGGAGANPYSYTGASNKGVDTGVQTTPAGGGTSTAPNLDPKTGLPVEKQGYFQTLGNRISDPAKMADMTLLAAPNIAGSIYAQQAGKEQQKRIDEYQAELKRLEGQDQAAYQAKLQEYNDFVAQAKAINPDYWAQQTANAAQVSGAKSLAEGFRDDRFAGLRTPGYGASERRRASLGLTANVGSAYDRGYAGGLDMRNTALSRAQSMYPTAPRGMQAGLKEVASMYSDLDTSRAMAGQGATKMATYMTYPLLSKDTRDMYRYNA
jgi:hypothetical protein